MSAKSRPELIQRAAKTLFFRGHTNPRGLVEVSLPGAAQPICVSSNFGIGVPAIEKKLGACSEEVLIGLQPA